MRARPAVHVVLASLVVLCVMLGAYADEDLAAVAWGGALAVLAGWLVFAVRGTRA